MFFKKRAVLEEEFGRGMQKLAKNTAEGYAMNDGKAGSVSSFLFSMSPSLDSGIPASQLFRQRMADNYENTRNHSRK